MLKTKLFFFVIALFMAFTACKKDKDETTPKNQLEENYFTIEGALYNQGSIPAASQSAEAPKIESLYGNNSVLAGGSNPITIETASNITNILIGINGETGYYKLPVSNLKATNAEYLFFLMVSQNLTQENFEILIAILDANGLVSQHSTIQVAQVQAGTGKLQISCTWDKLNDVDLHLVEPSEEEIYYGNSYSVNGGELDVDSNPGCVIDGINNENITYSEDAIVENGEYIVRVDLFSNCDITDITNFQVTAYYDGELLAPSTGSNPYQGTFVPEDEDYGAEGAGRTIMKFSIGSITKSTKQNNQSLIRFSYPANKLSKSKNLSPNK